MFGDKDVLEGREKRSYNVITTSARAEIYAINKDNLI